MIGACNARLPRRGLDGIVSVSEQFGMNAQHDRSPVRECCCTAVCKAVASLSETRCDTRFELVKVPALQN